MWISKVFPEIFHHTSRRTSNIALGCGVMLHTKRMRVSGIEKKQNVRKSSRWEVNYSSSGEVVRAWLHFPRFRDTLGLSRTIRILFYSNFLFFFVQAVCSLPALRLSLKVARRAGIDLKICQDLVFRPGPKLPILHLCTSLTSKLGLAHGRTNASGLRKGHSARRCSRLVLGETPTQPLQGLFVQSVAIK